jgi:hypothetical protein
MTLLKKGLRTLPFRCIDMIKAALNRTKSLTVFFRKSRTRGRDHMFNQIMKPKTTHVSGTMSMNYFVKFN